MLMEIKPSNIHFSINIIDNVFHRNSHHCYCRIGETLDSLCEEKIKIRDIPPISVKRYKSVWLTVNNRRLWVFRQMERLGKCASIPVVVVKEIPVPTPTYIVGMNVTVRENPGGIWYLLPSCEMQDPFNTVIWDTAKHIKEFMHPPPSPRVIIKIFQNLSQRGDHAKSIIVQEEKFNTGVACSEVQTFSSGYVENVDVLNNNEVDASKKEPTDKATRTEEWVLNLNIYQPSNEFVLGQALYDFREDVVDTEHLDLYHRSIPDYVTECKPISIVQEFDAFDSAELHSEASELTSGYVFVTGDGDNSGGSNLNDNFEMPSVCGEIEHDNTVKNTINSQKDAEVPNINDVTNSIIDKAEGVFLSRQGTESENVSELRAYIGNILQNTFAKYNEKCLLYEREILILKEETENSIVVRQEELETLKKQVKEIERKFQEELKIMRPDCQCHETANSSQGGNDAVMKSKANDITTEGNSNNGNNFEPQDKLDRESCKRVPDKSDADSSTSETQESDIIQRLKEQNRKLKNRNHRLKQNMQRLKALQNENLHTFAESLFLNTRRRANSE